MPARLASYPFPRRRFGMKVWIKNFDVAMELKNKGIEFDVYSKDGKQHLGDLIITKTQLIWCKGKTGRKNGKVLSLEDFVAAMNDK